MKRFKVIGLCLIAVFALAAVFASGAQAGEFGKCEKANPKKTGKYSEKSCETLAVPANTGKYEWVPYAGPPIATASFGGESSLKGGAGEIKCKRAFDTGEITGPKTNKEKFTFIECELLPFKFVCKNGETEIEGKKVPSLATFNLKTKLLDHGEKGPSGKEPAEKEVWNVIEAEEENVGFTGKGFFLAAFECGPGIPFEVTGSVSGVIPALFVSNPKLKKGKAEVFNPKFKKGKATYEEDYTAAGGEQDLTTTFFNPESKKVESGASIQEGTNNIAVPVLPKGLEILDL